MPKISEYLRSTHGRDGAIVLNMRKGQMFSLNLVGSRVLELLKAGIPGSEIADQISREFHVSRDIVDQDIQEFVRSLAEHKLLEGE